MQIKGKYKTDSNFIDVYTDDTLYTIPKNNPSSWGCLKVGQYSYSRQLFDRETFERGKSECTKEGTFTLAED